MLEWIFDVEADEARTRAQSSGGFRSYDRPLAEWQLESMCGAVVERCFRPEGHVGLCLSVCVEASGCGYHRPSRRRPYTGDAICGRAISD